MAHLYPGRDGQLHQLNNDLLKYSFSVLTTEHGASEAMYNAIAEKACCGRRTVVNWMKGINQPSDIKMIEAIEDIMGLERGALLIPTYSAEKPVDTEEYNARREIEQMFNYVNALFGKMCEMIYFVTQGLGSKEPVDPEFPEIDEYYNDSIPIERKYKNQEQYRNQCILDVHKSSLCLSQSTVQKCVALINDAFGEKDPVNNDCFYNSEQYREYLKTANMIDSAESRLIYGGIFRKELLDRLVDIFRDYSFGRNEYNYSSNASGE